MNTLVNSTRWRKCQKICNIGKVLHYNFHGKEPDDNLKERDDRGAILDPPEDINNTDSLHAHITGACEKYQDREITPA